MAHYEDCLTKKFGFDSNMCRLRFVVDYDFTIGGLDHVKYPGKMTRDGYSGSAPMLHTVVQEKRSDIIVHLYTNTDWIQIYPYAYISTEIFLGRPLCWLNILKPDGKWILSCLDLPCQEISSQDSSGNLLMTNPTKIYFAGSYYTSWLSSGCVACSDNKISYFQAEYRDNRWTKNVSASETTIRSTFNLVKLVDYSTYVVSNHPSDMEDIYWCSQEIGTLITSSRIASNFREAYCDAAQKMPQQTLNILENLLDIISLFKDPKSLLKIGSLSDLWLKYRYVYNTTKLDVTDTRELLQRLKDLSDRQVIKVSGTFTEGHDTTVETYKFFGKYSAENFLTGTLTQDLQQYFGKIRIQDLWDVVPFSFIADWLTNIGNNISNMGSYCELQKLVPIETWATMTRTIANVTTYETHFLRIKDFIPYGLPRIQFSKGPSDTTILSRITDVVSIFGG